MLTLVRLMLAETGRDGGLGTGSGARKLNTVRAVRLKAALRICL